MPPFCAAQLTERLRVITANGPHAFGQLLHDDHESTLQSTEPVTKQTENQTAIKIVFLLTTLMDAAISRVYQQGAFSATSVSGRYYHLPTSRLLPVTTTLAALSESSPATNLTVNGQASYQTEREL